MKETGRYAEIPAGDYPVIEQAAVALKASQDEETGCQSPGILKTYAIQDLLRCYGFSVPRASEAGR
jgi:hypothetical protein